jgi:hypothetical protein
MIGRAKPATREMTAPECRNIEGYLTLWLTAVPPEPPRQ